MATCFGWTWEYIDECVTLPRCYEIWSAWKKCPPLHIAFAGFVGAFKKEKPTAGASEATHEEHDDLAAGLSAAGIGMQKLDPQLLAMMQEP